MKRICFLLLSFVFSYNMSAQNKADITKPMFGEVERDERYKKLDDDFRKSSFEKFGSRDSAVADYVNKSWLYFCNNDLGTAMVRFNQAWILNPYFPDVYFGFAALLEMQGNYEEANRFYRLGAEKDENNKRTIICFQRIAECKEQLNDLQGATAALLKISQFMPKDAFPYKKIGYLQMTLGDHTFALDAYTKAIELDPNDPVTFYNRAYLHQSLDAYQKAVSDYTRCVIIDPTYVSAYVNRGIMEMKLGNYDAGRQDFETGLRLNGQSGEIRRLLGIAKLSKNDRTGACEDFKIAKKLGDKDVDDLIKQYCK